MTDSLSAEAITKGLGTTRLGRPVHVLDTCESTNDVAFDLLAGGAEHGTLVVADTQTKGRGQRGRIWHSPRGLSIYGTLVLRASGRLPAPTLLVAAVGLGLAEGLERAAQAEVGLKWPNDLWLSGRKLGGVLVESRGADFARPALVAGFGINVNHRAADFPEELRATATSLALRTGRRFERAMVIRMLLEALEPRVEQALGGGASAQLHQAYRERSVLLGQRVVLLEADRELEGVVADLSATDGLLLRTDDGRTVHVRAEHARDVRLAL